jgi:hypothetical protein
MATPEQLSILRAMAGADFDRQKELSNALHASGDLEGYGDVTAAAFYVAIRRQFPRRYSAEDVIRLVADARTMFDYSGEVINPQSAEKVVRAALGEHELAADIGDAEVVQTQIIVCSYLAAVGRLGDVDAFMSAVKEILAEWAADDEMA